VSELSESLNAESRTIKCALDKAVELPLSNSARVDVEILLAFVLKKNRSYFYAFPERNLTTEQWLQFLSLFERRKQGEPIAYIIGRKGFWTLELEVNNSTLIPRPETELLVELALEKIQDQSRILDLGTGSGAIALALGSEFQGAEVVGVDRVESAVSLAEKNKQQSQLNNVYFFTSHWFEKVEGYFDVIVSNPPYIDALDPHLTQGDVAFEPSSALVSDECGLADIVHIISAGRKFLYDDAFMLIEHGYQQGPAVERVFAENGYQDIQTHKDYAGQPRVTLARWAI